MLTILKKTIANTVNTFVTIIFTAYYIQQRSFNKVNKIIVVEKWQNHCYIVIRNKVLA